jgi:hypothetical protein
MDLIKEQPLYLKQQELPVLPKQPEISAFRSVYTNGIIDRAASNVADVNRTTFNTPFEDTQHLIIKDYVKPYAFTEQFFSRKNVETIDALLKFAVKNFRNVDIMTQDQSSYLTIMRGTLITYSRLPKDPKEFQNEIDRLNVLVVKQMYPYVRDALDNYISYLIKIDKPIVQIKNAVGDDNIRSNRETPRIF